MINGLYASSTFQLPSSFNLPSSFRLPPSFHLQLPSFSALLSLPLPVPSSSQNLFRHLELGREDQDSCGKQAMGFGQQISAAS